MFMRGKQTPSVVQQLAQKLEAWAQGETVAELTPSEQIALRWLLSRCKSRAIEMPEDRTEKGTEYKGRYEIKRININDINIQQMVIDALRDFSLNPGDLPTSGWVRGDPMWPRSYSWPRS
jgi:hypothetical protein